VFLGREGLKFQCLLADLSAKFHCSLTHLDTPLIRHGHVPERVTLAFVLKVHELRTLDSIILRTVNVTQ
jgi:hypothetical protein